MLETDLPIIQAPMAGGSSTPELTAAVIGAGGYGFLAAGYLSAAALRQQIRDLRALTDAPFGVNLFLPSTPGDPAAIAAYAGALEDEARRLGAPLGEPSWDDDGYHEKLALLAAERVGMASCTFGCPSAAEVDTMHSAGVEVSVTVTSAAEAQVAEQAGADLVIAQGTEAGGHQASFLDLRPNETPLLSLIGAVRAASALPIVASGALMTGTGIADALRAGAIAAQLGTAFLLCREAGTSAVHRAALGDDSMTATETMITRAFTGRYARGLANRFAIEFSAIAPQAYPEIHHLTRPLRALATAAADSEVPNLWAGTGWQRARSEPAADTVGRIAAELRTAQ